MGRRRWIARHVERCRIIIIIGIEDSGGRFGGGGRGEGGEVLDIGTWKAQALRDVGSPSVLILLLAWLVNSLIFLGSNVPCACSASRRGRFLLTPKPP